MALKAAEPYSNDTVFCLLTRHVVQRMTVDF